MIFSFCLMSIFYLVSCIESLGEDSGFGYKADIALAWHILPAGWQSIEYTYWAAAFVST